MESGEIRLAVSTEKGAFILKSSNYRSNWSISKGLMTDQSVNNIISTDKGTLFAATLTDGIFRSYDKGKNWNQSSKGLIVRKVWSIEQDKHNQDNLLAGTQYGHMFSSADSGNTWEEVVGLYDAPNRNNWGIDWGFGTTGLTIHTIKSDPNKKNRFYIVASGNGTYRTDDYGKKWKALKEGLLDDCPLEFGSNTSKGKKISVEEKKREHLQGVHSCTHKLALSPSRRNTIFQQNHCGVFKSTNSGDRWSDISPENNRHGFGITVTPGDIENIFTIPANQRKCKKHNSCIQGQLTVLRSADSGKTWDSLTNGLPSKIHNCVLRDCLTNDNLPEPGVYFGTTTGEVYASLDLGHTWKEIATNLPRIQGVSVIAA